jgi:hypothetical protein
MIESANILSAIILSNPLSFWLNLASSSTFRQSRRTLLAGQIPFNIHWVKLCHKNADQRM